MICGGHENSKWLSRNLDVQQNQQVLLQQRTGLRAQSAGEERRPLQQCSSV